MVQCARVSLTPAYVPVTLKTTVQQWASVPLSVKAGLRSLRRFAMVFGKLPIQFRKRRNRRERMSI